MCSTFSRSIAPGTATTIQLICSDPEGDPITLEKVAGPTHGTLGAIDQGTDQAIYTPDAGYNGVDSFTYRATDGTVTGATATVTLNVTRAPTCQNVARTTKVGTAVSIPLTCTDPDGDTLTLSKVTDPAHGTLGAISAGSVTYTPTAGYFGPDSFTYKANDGTANSTPATVSITVTRPASCSDVSRRTKIGTAVSVPLTCTDADGDALTLSIVNGPAHGTLGTISGGAVSYTPTADYFGADSFTFKASDGTAESAPATASITVTRAPSCADVSRKTAVGVAVSVPLSCTDPDGDSLTLSKVTDPAHGSLGAISGSSVTYTPTAGYFGADSFTYKASDGAADSPAATVSLTVTRPPTCDAVSRKTKVNTAVSVPLSCTDPDGDALTLSKVANPSKGTLGAISSGSVTYTPNAGEFGADSFTYKASDGTADSAAATVSITITRAPTCSTVSVKTKVGTAVQVPLSCTDPDGDTLTFSKLTDPSKGTLGSPVGNAITYTPNAGEFGADSFTYKASDGTADSAAATANITITRAPSCQDVARSVRAGSSVSVPLTCTDPDADSLTLSKVTDPTKGTLGAISGGAVTYTANAGTSGQDTFTYKASDGTAESAPATVTITITRAAEPATTSRGAPAPRPRSRCRSPAPTPMATR